MKNKNFQRIMALSLIVILNLSISPIYAEELDSKLLKDRIDEIEAAIELEDVTTANAEYNRFIQTVRIGDEYPSYYAGAYLNEDNNLVVMTTDNSKESLNEIRSATGNDKVTVQYAQNSMNYLKNLQTELGDKYTQLYAQRSQKDVFVKDEEIRVLDDLVGFYVDEGKNELVVEITNITDEKISAFKNLFGDINCIRYEEGYYPQLTALEWRPGRKVFTPRTSASTGYRAYCIDSNGTRYNGFVSAGHGFNVGDSAYYAENRSVKLGECKVSQFGGNNDAAFIAITNSNYEASNTMYYASDGTNSTAGGVVVSATSYVTELATYTPIFKVGCRSFATSGVVLSENYTATYDGTQCTNLIKSTVPLMKGDSGGCVFIYDNGTYKVVGNVSGASFTGDYDDPPLESCAYSMFSQIEYAISELGIRKY